MRSTANAWQPSLSVEGCYSLGANLGNSHKKLTGSLGMDSSYVPMHGDPQTFHSLSRVRLLQLRIHNKPKQVRNAACQHFTKHTIDSSWILKKAWPDHKWLGLWTCPLSESQTWCVAKLQYSSRLTEVVTEEVTHECNALIHRRHSWDIHKRERHPWQWQPASVLLWNKVKLGNYLLHQQQLSHWLTHQRWHT